MEGIIASLSSKADNTQLKELKKHLQRLATSQELETLRAQLQQKAEKGQIRHLHEQMRDLGNRVEESQLRTAKRDEFLGHEIQMAKVGLTECVQKMAEKASRAQVDSQQRQLKELQKFDAQKLKKSLLDKIKEEKGEPVAEGLIPRAKCKKNADECVGIE